MSIRANFSKSYLNRYILITAICLGWAGWCAWDGLVRYPQHYIYALEYDKLKDLQETERQKQWKAITQEKGWPSKKPKEPTKVKHDINSQFLMGGLGLAIGLPSLFSFFLSRKSWIESTERGVRASWGVEFDFDHIELIDKKKWEKKGLARVRYRAGDRHKVFVLDDFKFEREPTDKILRLMESELSDDQIVGGYTEKEADRIHQLALQQREKEEAEQAAAIAEPD